jgi:hypothetical protein
MMREREGLIARIRQVRRLAATRDRPDGGDPNDPTDRNDPKPEPLQALEERVMFLERLVQGLQDSVHRESDRHSKLIAELQDRVRPEAMGAALAEDARNRGL